MIPDIFLSDRQLISLVAYIAAFIMHLFLVGTNSAPCIAARKRFTFTETRAREENPGREIEETHGGGVMCMLKRKLKLRKSLLNRCKRPVNGGM